MTSPYIKIGFCFWSRGVANGHLQGGATAGGTTVFFEKVENQKCILNLNILNHNVAKKMIS